MTTTPDTTPNTSLPECYGGPGAPECFDGPGAYEAFGVQTDDNEDEQEDTNGDRA